MQIMEAGAARHCASPNTMTAAAAPAKLVAFAATSRVMPESRPVRVRNRDLSFLWSIHLPSSGPAVIKHKPYSIKIRPMSDWSTWAFASLSGSR